MQGGRAEFNFGKTLESGESELARKEYGVDRDCWVR